MLTHNNQLGGVTLGGYSCYVGRLWLTYCMAWIGAQPAVGRSGWLIYVLLLCLVGIATWSPGVTRGRVSW